MWTVHHEELASDSSPPRCRRLITGRAAVGIGIPVGIPMGMGMGMIFYPHRAMGIFSQPEITR